MFFIINKNMNIDIRNKGICQYFVDDVIDEHNLLLVNINYMSYLAIIF